MTTPATQPTPKRSVRRRAWIVASVILAGITGGIAWGEWRGWPFLAMPLQNALTEALQRPVHIAARAAPGTPGIQVFRVHFFGGLRLYAPRIEVAGPSWRATAPLVSARNVALELRYRDLWRAYRGEPLQVRRLEAGNLSGQVERLADGRASWQFRSPSAPPTATSPLPIPSFNRLRVAVGSVRYRDEPLAIDVAVRFSLTEDVTTRGLRRVALAPAQAGEPPTSGLHAQATGYYRDQPLSVNLVSSGVLPWVDEKVTIPIPMAFEATVNRAQLAFNGGIEEPLLLAGMTGTFSVRGPSLAAIGDPLGVTLPTTAKFHTEGAIAKQGNIWHVYINQATIGASRLEGAFTYDKGRPVPLLAGRLEGSRLLLVDLGPVVGSTPEAETKKGKVLPTRPFDLASLRVMDADVRIDIAKVDLNTRVLEPLRPLRGHLQLANGVLTIRDLDARTASGQLQGSLQLQGQEDKAVWKADLRVAGVRLERWVKIPREKGEPPLIAGRLQGRVAVKGEGRSTAEILAGLNGQARFALRQGKVSHLVIEGAGLDLAQALGVLIKGDETLPISCAVADLEAKKGVIRPRVLVVDTPDSAAWVGGSLSLAEETMKMRVVVMPKDFSPLTLRAPLQVKGSFTKPDIGLEEAPIARKVATSLVLSLINPLAALVPLLDMGNPRAAKRGAAGCHELLRHTGVRMAGASESE